MTTTQRIQWTILPHGPADEGARLASVFVAPRLRSDVGDTLSAYPDFVSWPEVVSATNWQVSVDGADVPSAVAGDPPDQAFWAALFPPTTTVTPYEFDDYADRPMVTYGVGSVVDTLRQLYARTAAAAPDDLPRLYSARHVEPPVLGLDDLLGPLREVIDGELFHVDEPSGRQEVVARRLAAAREQSRQRRTVGPRGGPSPVDPWLGRPEVARALFFHSRPELEPREMPADGDHYRARIGFHEMISALGDHPELLRRLGLVVDLRVEAQDLPDSAPGAPRLIRVTPTLPAPAAPDVVRVDVVHDTAYVSQEVPGVGAVFTATARTPDPLAPPGAVPTGLMPLPESMFRLEQIDVDGAALKAVNAAATVYQPASAEAEQPLHQPDTAGLPALRTGGLLLVQTARTTALQGDFARTLAANASVEQGDSITLYAEDLVRGHRLDILDATTGRWHSLHRVVETVTAERHAGEIPTPGARGLRAAHPRRAGHPSWCGARPERRGVRPRDAGDLGRVEPVRAAGGCRPEPRPPRPGPGYPGDPAQSGEQRPGDHDGPVPDRRRRSRHAAAAAIRARVPSPDAHRGPGRQRAHAAGGRLLADAARRADASAAGPDGQPLPPVRAVAGAGGRPRRGLR